MTDGGIDLLESSERYRQQLEAGSSAENGNGKASTSRRIQSAALWRVYSRSRGRTFAFLIRVLALAPLRPRSALDGAN